MSKRKRNVKEVVEFKDRIDHIVNDDELSWKVKQEIISSIIDTYFMNELDVPDVLINAQYLLTSKEMLEIYVNDKKRFFNIFEESINYDKINFADIIFSCLEEDLENEDEIYLFTNVGKIFNYLKDDLVKDDAEIIEAMIAAKKYNI